MFGKLLSDVVKVITLPIDVTEITLDVLTGGDGSKESFDQSGLPRPSEIRDKVCEKIEEIDD